MKLGIEYTSKPEIMGKKLVIELDDEEIYQFLERVLRKKKIITGPVKDMVWCETETGAKLEVEL